MKNKIDEIEQRCKLEEYSRFPVLYRWLALYMAIKRTPMPSPKAIEKLFGGRRREEYLERIDALRIIVRNPGITIKDLIAKSGIRQHRIAKIVSGFEEIGRCVVVDGKIFHKSHGVPID
jgi:hypothetical protein